MTTDLHRVVEAVEDDKVVIAVHAQAGAGRSEVVGRHGDALKVRVAVPPERGRANEAIARLLAETLGVPAASVSITPGRRRGPSGSRSTTSSSAARRVLERLMEPCGGGVDPRAGSYGA